MKKYGLTKKAYEIGMFKFLALSKEQVEDFSSFEKEEAILKIKQLHPELSDNEIEKQLGIFTLQQMCTNFFELLLQFEYAIELKSSEDVLHALLLRLDSYLEPYKDKVNGYSTDIRNSELYIYVNNNEQILIKVVYSEKNQQLYIPNIMIHESMKHKGIGRGMIKQCLYFALSIKCELLVVDLVDSFHERLLKRNAVQSDNWPGAVFITLDTDLS